MYTSIQPVGVTYLIRDKPKNWNINESVFSLRPDAKKVTPEFLYILISSPEIKIYTKNNSAGSVHKGIRHETLKGFTFAYSGKTLIDQFTEVIKPILKKYYFIEQENRSLNNLRNWLLPMIMNGQVKVND